MPVLSRRKAETIRIGGNIEIHIIEIRGGRVRIGIRAPREIPVVRSEIAVTQTVGAVHDATSEADVQIPAAPARPRCPR